MKYEAIVEMSKDEIESAIIRDHPDELLIASLSASLYSTDRDWAENVCTLLANHEHFNVRGNAILGFGHIARLHGKLGEHIVRPLIERALTDTHEYVRRQAEAAADDLEHFLKWKFNRSIDSING